MYTGNGNVHGLLRSTGLLGAGPLGAGLPFSHSSGAGLASQRSAHCSPQPAGQ